MELLPEEPDRREELAAHPLYGGGGGLPESVAESDGPRCAAHNAPAHGECSRCDAPVCSRCRLLVGGKVLCASCRSEESWRTPGSLRLALVSSGLCLLLSAFHRFVVARSPSGPLLPSSLQLPPQAQDLLRWEVLGAYAARAAPWGQLLAVVTVLVALVHSRSPTAQTGSLAGRILLTCLFAGSAIVLASDSASALLAGWLR